MERVYWWMRDHNLLLERRINNLACRVGIEGRIAVQTSDTRWCSDGFEFRCYGRRQLSVTFAFDCCDREIIGWGRQARPGTAVMIFADLMLKAWRSVLRINCPPRRCNG